ncbi:hypothetical protein MKY53_02660 [Macrococcus sp. FSL R5-0951]
MTEKELYELLVYYTDEENLKDLKINEQTKRELFTLGEHGLINVDYKADSFEEINPTKFNVTDKGNELLDKEF